MHESRFVDLSHTVVDGMVTYKGLPAPVICDFLSRKASQQVYPEGTSFHIGKIEMVANTGTYIDAPFHRYEKGLDLSELPLTSLANLPIQVIRVPNGLREIGVEYFFGKDLRGRAVLVETGWDRLWQSEAYFEGHPFLNRAAAEYLRERGSALVGIDSLNIDDTEDGQRPVHTILLGADIPIIEHMTNLSELPDEGGHLFAVPVKLANFGAFPVRAFVQLPAAQA
jgi:kynurenine formamidase